MPTNDYMSHTGFAYVRYAKHAITRVLFWLALEQHTYGTLCYVADIQPG